MTGLTAARETELVPSVHHSSRVIQTVILLLRQGDLQSPVFGRDRAWIIPLQVIGDVIMNILGRPIWVISIVKAPSVRVEFVREYQLPRFARLERRVRIGFERCIWIDQAKVTDHIRDLARTVDAADIV